MSDAPKTEELEAYLVFDMRDLVPTLEEAIAKAEKMPGYATGHNACVKMTIDPANPGEIVPGDITRPGGETAGEGDDGYD